MYVPYVYNLQVPKVEGNLQGYRSSIIGLKAQYYTVFNHSLNLIDRNQM